jgi:poly(A) polymerase
VKVSGEWLERPATQNVCKMLEDGGHQALLVGGCIRNALLGETVSDIDISTDAKPERVIALAKAAGFRAIPTGIDHGTITVVADHIPHEITTFRKDVATDGRRAVVAFSDRVEDDAHRRDFTMNALYATRDGVVVDPLGGLVDLKARRFVFIDDAGQRIQEDYLRILRYFRFHAWYGDQDAGMDAETLAAISENLAGLDSLSRERVGSEMRKLLAARDPSPAVATMRQCGVLLQVLDGADDKALAPLVHLEGAQEVAPNAMRRLAALGGTDVGDALRLSRKEVAEFNLLRAQVAEMQSGAELGYRLGAEVGLSVLLLRSALLEMPFDPNSIDQLRKGAESEFPVKPADLLNAYQGPALGQKLRELEKTWIESGFQASKSELLG